MKKIISILVPAAAAMILAVACVKTNEIPEQPAEGEVITIKASIPEDTKVEYEANSETNNLHLKWTEDDVIRVISGSDSKEFYIKDGFTDHEAEFTGTAVSGESFNIIYPGDEIRTMDEALAYNYEGQVQNGNGNTDHLRYIACLSGVNTYESFTFSEEWAAAHGGTILLPAIAKIIATLPAGVSNLSKVTLTCSYGPFSLGLKNVDVSASSQVLTAYALLPIGGATLPGGEPISLAVTDADGADYVVSFTLSAATQLQQGHVSVFKFTQGFEKKLFAGGDGTEASPYLIATPAHLMNMHEVMADNQTIYFEMIDDVDMTGKDWTALNPTSKYLKAIHFDGKGHTISHLTVGSRIGYPSFVGVLNGTICNVTFDKASIDAGNANTGVVAGYIGTGSGTSMIVGHCEGVTVSNSTIVATATQTNRNTGGFAGVLGSEASTIKNCHVTGKNTLTQTASYKGCSVGGLIGNVATAGTITDCTATADINSPDSYYNGGFIGQVGGAVAAEITRCAYLGGTINAGRSADLTNSPVAGFVGRIAGNAGAVFTDCYVDGAIIEAPQSGRVGGFVGDTGSCSTAYTTFTSCYVKNSTLSGAQHVGGFGGVFYVNADKCYVESTTINANNDNNGGFGGYVQKAFITNCYCSTNVVGGSFNNNGGFIGNSKDSNVISCCYETSTVSGPAESLGAFVGGVMDGYDEAKATVITKCIAWNGSLPFYGAVGSKVVNEETLYVDVSKITDNYTGTEGTISAQATTLGWDNTIWDLSASEPKLK
ncbi:MAG: hypothetical protein J5640_03630 [Bacteroidales bacterium]|nr:hypothetical protein [Bacteroidales bacterium]